MSASPLPHLLPHLYVDLDGTLIASDLLHESVLLLLRDHPLQALRIPGWLASHGVAPMKRRIAERVQLDASLLPYRPAVLDAIRRARTEGRRVVLATASDRLLADGVARHLGLFDAVIASDGSANLKGRRKLDAIRADAAGHPFTYMSDGHVDLPVWQGAQGAVVVSNDAALRRRVREVARVEAELDVPKPTLRDVLYGLRLHQWLKNLLVFVPMLPVMGEVTGPMALSALAMFLAFGLCASAVYVFNDLLDLESDRQHARKRERPFASGLIPIRSAVLLGGALLLSSIALAVSTLPPLALAALATYVVLTTAYSSWLKRKMLVDVFALAMLYTMRILAGAAATGIAPSFWLLGFSLFMFLSLALAKRYVEIAELQRGAERLRVRGRAYATSDSVFVLCAGLTAGQLAILTLSLYLNDHETVQRYDQPYVLWSLCPLLLYWLVRVWLKAHRGELHHDPVVFAATDRISLMIVLACVMLIVVAS